MTLVELGRIVKPHGVRGELKVRLHWEHSETLFGIDSVLVAQGAEPPSRHAVESIRPGPKGVLLKLSGVDDRGAAESFRGASVSVERAQLPELEPGEYYLCDLMDARVVAPEGAVGRVVEIRAHPTVDALVIETPDGKRLEQPIAEPWVAEVDVEHHLVRLANTEGLM